MITPAFGLTATERVLPRLALDFTTAALDPRITFTRSGNTATVVNSSGVIALVNADIPRFDYNPTTLVCNGLLIEESRTNVLLNSLLNGTSLATQFVTVTAAARTLTFYGTGQIVLSGAASATVTGTGAYPTRTTLTFTPSAGVLTLTVTGTVQFAQLELGSFATSFIPTAASQVTRTADVATMTGTNFSDWFNASEGTLEAYGMTAPGISGTQYILSATDGTTSNMVLMYRQLSGFMGTGVYTAGAVQHDSNTGVLQASSSNINGALSVKAGGAYRAFNAASNTAIGLTTMPSVNQFQIGNRTDLTRAWNGTIARIDYYPQKLTNSEVIAISK